MTISVEVPVFKGGWLQHCIESVLSQTNEDWSLSLLWDGGDRQSRQVLERLERKGHPRIHVFYGENRGIAGARRFLSEHSSGDFILPLDDDDVLPSFALEKFAGFVADKPWAAVVRARRRYIDESGRVVDMSPWFPFEPRHYQHGMVTDVFNHSQPYLIRRSAYERTSGWEGFPDLLNAGEDCDIFLKLEEAGSVELLDQYLYYYRINPDRASKVLTDEAAFEMWRRLADKTIARLGLPLERINDVQPFRYRRLPRDRPDRGAIDFVVLGATEGAAAAAPAVRSLRACGIAADAIHSASRDGGAAAGRNRGFVRTKRSLVCFVDAGVEIGGPESLDILLQALHQREADVVAPAVAAPGVAAGPGVPSFGEDARVRFAAAADGPVRREGGVIDAPWLPAACLLTRREVVNATGGFAEGWLGELASEVDFALKARCRDFRCLYVPGAVVSVDREPAAPLVDEHDLDTLRRKWSSRPHLLAPS